MPLTQDANIWPILKVESVELDFKMNREEILFILYKLM